MQAAAQPIQTPIEMPARTETEIETAARDVQAHAPPGRPPAGAGGWPLVGVLPPLLRDPLRFCSAAAARHEGLVRLDLGPARVYLVTHPDYVRRVLLDNQANYWKGAVNHRAKFLLGEGLVTSDGEFWRRQRRAVQPAFHGRRLAGIAGLVTAAANGQAERWAAAAGETGGIVDAAKHMQSLSMEIVGRATLGGGLTPEDVEAVGEAVTLSLQHVQLRFFTFFLAEWVRLPGQRRAEKALARLDTLVFRQIHGRRASGERGDDVLSMLLEVEAEGGGMGDRQLHDELVTLLVAGGEAPALALTWTWHLLAGHPEVEARLHAELAEVLGGRLPGFADLPRLVYTRMVIDEAMRLYPPVWMFFRVAHGADRFGDFVIPAGAPLLLSPYVTQRDARFWPDPDAFAPERFAPERTAARHPFAYFPFSGGPRICLGMSFALMEAQLVLATLAQRFCLRELPGRPAAPQAAASLQPRHGLPMRLVARD